MCSVLNHRLVTSIFKIGQNVGKVFQTPDNRPCSCMILTISEAHKVSFVSPQTFWPVKFLHSNGRRNPYKNWQSPCVKQTNFKVEGEEVT
jgi:hypothetical protein